VFATAARFVAFRMLNSLILSCILASSTQLLSSLHGVGVNRHALGQLAFERLLRKSNFKSCMGSPLEFGKEFNMEDLRLAPETNAQATRQRRQRTGKGFHNMWVDKLVTQVYDISFIADDRPIIVPPSTPTLVTLASPVPVTAALASPVPVTAATILPPSGVASPAVTLSVGAVHARSADRERLAQQAAAAAHAAHVAHATNIASAQAHARSSGVARGGSGGDRARRHPSHGHGERGCAPTRSDPGGSHRAQREPARGIPRAVWSAGNTSTGSTSSTDAHAIIAV
jgi:hypothetical protein